MPCTVANAPRTRSTDVIVIDNTVWFTASPAMLEGNFRPTTHVDRSLQMIRDAGCKSGLVFNPATLLDHLRYVIDEVDMVLLMSVNPGFGGQSFIPEALGKLREARKIIDDSGNDIRLEIDGGVKVNNIGEIAAAGADTFVAGSAIFGADDYKATIDAMRAEIAKATG